MAIEKVVVVIDMQNGVFAHPRFDRQGRITRINQLIDRADHVIFIQHIENEMAEGSELWQLLPELHRPESAISVNKTACDAFYRTQLDNVIAELSAPHLTICGCATDYCVDTTIKIAASKGYALTIAADAHTTANRRHVTAEQLIAHHNEVWADLTVPDNRIRVKTTQQILDDWAR
ncbi:MULTISPECIES: isochorismatase family protein [Yersinia]|uniref:isochorismatase family protein n=2 Tax=Yersiniaceae TaxID=1903411 RepID=UPI0005E0B4C8|nr:MULTISPECIES: isochorismatase family protein [Yersinia]OVZ98626.1 Isochorismatase [Yersinia frederiksenii]RXA94424.1 isochorismatase family protein [Yersinia sp. 2105 StPb PI]CNI13203.1 isochorismatase family protein [Yersinia frederiksenii]CNI45572.1 isochorismatase family protein [Yersinia frederiksenii]CNK69365.1 isochorismatase family protein [Yersinia frederiksenii]